MAKFTPGKLSRPEREIWSMLDEVLNTKMNTLKCDWPAVVAASHFKPSSLTFSYYGGAYKNI